MRNTYRAWQPASPTPDAPPHIAPDDWAKLSPGMRREIFRSAPELWAPAPDNVSKSA